MAKNFRNLIHPGRKKRLRQSCNRGTVLFAVAAIEFVINDLTAQPNAVLSEANEAYERKYRLISKGIDVETVTQKVAQIPGIKPTLVWAAGKHPKVVQARSLLCYWATSELGVIQVWSSKKLKLSQPAISLAVARGRAIAIQKNYGIEQLII